MVQQVATTVPAGVLLSLQALVLSQQPGALH